MSHQYATLEDTVYLFFGANDTSGSGGDGATPVYDVRLAGAAADAIPVLSGSATLLTHANYPDGCHEVAVAATAGNGFAAGNTYAVFCTLLVDSQNPTGFVGSFVLGPVLADMKYILGHLLEQTGTQVADGFQHFFDHATPAVTVGDAMVGTNSAALAAKLEAYVQLLARSDAAITTDRATELGEINADEGSGAGNYAATTDSQEASRDKQTDIEADTNELQADWADGGRLDLILDARAAESSVTSIQNNTRCVRVVPSVMERPDSGSTAFRIELLLYDSVGNMEAPDSAPTIGVVNNAGTSRDANLDSTTMTLVSTGRYRSTYTVANGHAIEQLIAAFAVVEGGNTRSYGNTAMVVDTTAVDYTAADRTRDDTLATAYTTARAGKLDNLDAAITSRHASGAAVAKSPATLATGDVTGNLPADVKAWDGGTLPTIGTSTLTLQQARDAMKLAPTAGDPAAGSVDKHLDDIPTNPYTGTPPTANENADALLGRNVSNVEATAPEHSLCTIVLACLESSVSGTVWTVNRTDGTTTHATKTVGTDDTADPITSVS